ncbi:hypothetical protein LCGC14_1887180, partial [marine sediment metagenome]
QVLNVEPGMTYQASTWVNTSDATEVFKLVIRDVFEKWIAQDEALIDGVSTWTNYATSFTVPDDRDQIIFRIAQTVDHNPLPFYIDDAEALEGDAAATPGLILIAVLDDITINHAGDPRGAFLTWVDYSSITTALDSNGNAWSDTISFTAYYGESLGQILDKLVNLGFEWELVPKAVPSGGKTHDLKLYNNEGRDATPDTAITVRQGVLGGEVVDRIPAFTAILAQGSGNIFYEDESAAAGDFGRFEKFLPSRDVADVAGLTLQTDNAFAEELSNRRAARFSIVETPYHARPGVNYIPGDTIPMQFPPTLSRELRRVVSFDYANTFPNTYSVTGSTILLGEAAAYELIRRMWRRFVPAPRERRSGLATGLSGPAGADLSVSIAASDASETSKRKADLVCDTTTDDRTVVDAALDRINWNGQVVLSEGSFSFDTGLLRAGGGGNVTFKGMGQNETIITSTTTMAYLFRATTAINWTWKDLTLDGGNTVVSSVTWGLADQGTYTMKDVRVQDFTGDGVSIERAAGTGRFFSCTFTANGGHGFSERESNCHFFFCHFTLNVGDGLHIEQTSGNQYIGCTFINNTGEGFSTGYTLSGNSHENLLQNGHFEGNGGTAQLRIQAGNGWAILDNYFEGATTSMAFGAGGFGTSTGSFINGNVGQDTNFIAGSDAANQDIGVNSVNGIVEIGEGLVPPSLNDTDITFEGNLSTGVGTIKKPFSFDVTIKDVLLAVGTSPIGADLVIDVNLNGVTIFTTQANRPKVLDGDADGIGVAAVPDVTAIAAGEYLTFDIDQTGSGGTEGDDLVITVEWEPA